jgi:PAS domain S-box-containing protein
MEDAAGARFIDANQSLPMLVRAANAPVFVLEDVDFGSGAVGGNVLSWAATGQIAASMALKILNGERPEGISIVKSTNVYMFDWRALRRWGFKESNLPPGSVLLYRQPSVWELYSGYIIGSISLILVEALLIFGLLWQRARRRKVEGELVITYERLRLAVTAGKSVGWDWDIGSGRDRWFGDIQTMFGIRSDTHSEHIEEFRRRIHPEDRKLVWKTVANAIRDHKPYISEFRVVRSDGIVRWIRANGSFYYTVNGRAKEMLGIAVDITERKLTEEKLRESEERFRLVANTAPVLIWMSGPDKLCNYFNQPWLEFTGRSVEAELGNGWTEGVHPEDLKICLDTYTSTFDRREPFKMQYRLRRNDGEYRWISDFGVPRFDPDGSFAGYIGSCLDVTDRKLVEEAWASLSGRLIDAQEEERKRIAREIHDDYSQQLAVVAMDLEGLAEEVGDSPVGAAQRFHNIWNQIGELGADLHSLSHRLHSSTLESLGLVAGVKAFCEEFANQKEIQVDFIRGNVPHGIPAEVALCLFRITQEGLRNIKRHSGAERAEVHLEVSGEDLHLSVIDRGKGFDVNKLSTRNGIGLRSMEERLRSLGGHLEVSSRPTEGTRIDAWLPLRVASRV